MEVSFASDKLCGGIDVVGVKSCETDSAVQYQLTKSFVTGDSGYTIA